MRELLALDANARGRLDVLELMVDDALDGARVADFRALAARFAVVAHGTELGIGAAEGVDADYVRRVASALAALHVRWYSEHLAFTRSFGIDLGHFAPISDSDEARAVLARNAGVVRAATRCPLLLENPADVLGWEAEQGGAALGRGFARALEAADAGALLDLTNLVLGARNDGYVARDFLDAMDLERVVEVHLAGGRFDGALWIDSHDHDVDAEALALLHVVAPRAPNLTAVIIERDDRLPALASLLGEVDAVRATLRSIGRAR